MTSLLVGPCSWCCGDAFITAPTRGTTESGSNYPFLIKQDGGSYPADYTMRYQQVYDASLFTNLDSTLRYITALTFLAESPFSNAVVGWTVTNMQLNLSTTQKRPDHLSSVFSDNIGEDDTLVFGPYQHQFGPIGTADGPVLVWLDRPFHYDPAKGNLLMDVRILNGSGRYDSWQPYLEAFASPTDEVSRVWATNANSATATASDTEGVTTVFQFASYAYVRAPTYSATESSSYYPFLIKQDGNSYPTNFTMRYQQVYDRTLFTNIDASLVYVSTLTFIGGSQKSQGIGFTVRSMQVNLSTTEKGADALSTNFAQNVGADDEVVFGPSDHSFSAVIPDGRLLLPLDRPFRYNPSKGNLLMDVRIFDGRGAIDLSLPHLNAFNSITDEVSRVWSTNVTSASASGIDSLGLTTIIEFSPIPTLCIFVAPVCPVCTSNAIFVTWPSQPAVFTLQATEHFGPNAVWHGVTNQLLGSPIGGGWAIQVQPASAGAAEYYRLIWPGGQ